MLTAAALLKREHINNCSCDVILRSSKRRSPEGRHEKVPETVQCTDAIIEIGLNSNIESLKQLRPT